MTTENKNAPETPDEAPSQGRCAVASGSALAFEESKRLFRVLNMATLLKLHAKTISRLCVKREPQEAIRQLAVMQTDAKELQIMLATWVEKLPLTPCISGHEARGSGASKTGIQQPLPARQGNPAYANILPNT